MLWLMTGTQTGEILEPTRLIIDLLHALCTVPQAMHSRLLSGRLSLQLPLCRHCDAV